MTNAVQFDPKDLLGAKLCDERYKVLTRLGSGSMGHVYRAYDGRLESDVVIKVPTLAKLMSEEFRNRFTRETTLMVRLSHPHIVKVIDVGEHEGVPLVVMQYLSGGTLRDRMTLPDGRAYAMRPSSLREWLPQIAKALDFVHGQSSIHRDVKPTNILFDEHGNAFLADFGLTKIMAGDQEEKNESGDTAAGFVVGTANYMAPEIVLGKDYDGKADQYSLGLTVYEALSATVPMHAASASATMVNQTRLKPKPLTELSPKIPPTVSAAVARAIAKRPGQRFENCQEFAERVVAGLKSSRKKRSSGPVSEGSTNRIAPAKTRVRDARRSRGKTSDSLAAGGGSRVRRRRDPLVGKITFRKGDEIPCPKCREGLPVPEKYGGQIGRCIHCKVRVRVGDNAESLEVLPEKKSSESSTSQELIIGEKVFGVEIPRRLVAGLVLGLVGILIVIAILFTRWFYKEDPEPVHRTFEKRVLNADE